MWFKSQQPTPEALKHMEYTYAYLSHALYKYREKIKDEHVES